MKCLEVWPDNFYRCFINNHKSKALSENRALCRITRQHQQSGHFRWPLRLRRDDTHGHLSSAQHTGDVPIMTIASSPRSPLFSFIPEAFEKFSHLYKKKKKKEYLRITKPTALIVQIRKRKPKGLQKFMTTFLVWGIFPHFLIACLPNSITGT